MDIINSLSGKTLYVQLNREEARFATLTNGAELINSHVLPTPVGAVYDGEIQDAEAIQALVKKILRRPEYKDCRKVIFSLSTSRVAQVTEDQIPNLPAKNLEKLIQANKDMYFKDIDMKDYKLQWQIIAPKMRAGQRELQVQLWAVPLDMLVKYYEVANGCGLSVARIDYCGSSIAAALGASFTRPVKVKAKEKIKFSWNMEISLSKKKETEQPEEEEVEQPAAQQVDTQLHIFLDNDLLGATFVQNGQVVQQRFISCGANPSFQFYELAMMVEFFRSTGFGRGSKITGFVSGGMADDAQLVAELSDILGITLNLPEGNIDPKFTLCIGAGKSSLDFGVPAMDVPKSGRKSDSQTWQLIAVAAAGVLLIASVVLLLTARLGWTSEKNDLQNQQQLLLIEVKKTSGYKEKYDKYQADYKKYSDDWDTLFGSLRTYNDNLVLALDELESALPNNTIVAVPPQLQSSTPALQISPDGLQVWFACSSKEEAAYLIMALRKLEYLELVSISSLVGGGGGPATSYGPQGGVEAPPTEGSYYALSNSDIDLLTQLMLANMDQQKLMQTFLNMTDAERAALEKTYVKKVNNNYSTIKQLKSAYATKDIFQDRKNAVHEMLTTNPVAVEAFVEQMKLDLKAENPVLLMHIMPDIMKDSALMNAMMGGSLENPSQAMNYMERLIKIMTKNETNLAATEELFSKDGVLQKWYIYYLEMELGLQKYNALGFLDMDKVIDDLMKGSFNTGDKTLDKKLNDLIPKQVWDMLKTLENKPSVPEKDPTNIPNPGPDDYSRTKLMLAIKAYRAGSATGDEKLDKIFKAYIDKKETGDKRWNDWMKKYELFFGNEAEKPAINKKPADFGDSKLMEMLFKYQSENSSGDAELDSLLDYYLVFGTTGDRAWDNWLKPYKGLLTGESGAPSSGDPGQYPVYFVVALKYKEALIKEELDRKGFDYEDKIEKVEVMGK